MSAIGQLINIISDPRQRTRGRTAIGIDVGSRTVKAIQLAGRRGREARCRVVAAAIFPRTDLAAFDGSIRESEVRALAERLGRIGFAGERIVLAAPSEALLQSVLELPPRSRPGRNPPPAPTPPRTPARRHKAISKGCPTSSTAPASSRSACSCRCST